jgi:hypothetical protein
MRSSAEAAEVVVCAFTPVARPARSRPEELGARAALLQMRKANSLAVARLSSIVAEHVSRVNRESLGQPV